MTFSSFLGLFGGLALVLGLMALLIRPFRAFALRTGRADHGTDLKVLSRVALAPKQGLAVVEFSRKTALISYGEGGVRLLMEGAEEEKAHEETLDEIRTGGNPPVPGLESGAFIGASTGAVTGVVTGSPMGPAAGTVWNRIRNAARAAGMSLMILGILQFARPETAAAADRSPPATMEQVVDQAAAPTEAQGAAAPTEAQGAAGSGLELLGQSFPAMDVRLGEGEDALRLSGPVGTVIFIGFLTLLPTVVLLMTGFTRILIVLHLLRQALGTQAAPPAHLLSAMALLLTAFVMAPTLGEVNRTALAPWTAGEIGEMEMLQTAAVPFREFMLGATREQDLETFLEIQGGSVPETVEEVPIIVVTSAFVTSELRNAFQMGFALFLPFVVIDLVVASVLMSMGMFMLPPVMVSLPFKLLLFVLVDGWSLVVGGIVRSFQGG